MATDIHAEHVGNLLRQPTSPSTTIRRTRRRSSSRSASVNGAAPRRQKNSKYSRISQSLTSSGESVRPAADSAAS